MTNSDKPKPKLKNDSEIPHINKYGSIRNCLIHALNEYFHDLGDQSTHNLHSFVFKEVEATLLETTLAFTNQNQSKAAEMLGINRGTLRKKLKEYRLI
ncbi:MAG: Fis family transcriptional regulator [Porticoccus sp.]|jgi:Fis family transcriptional regulator|nr:Fis family transcriptional regulator [Porticoccus sp.]|tara:strand:- start:352 stop:645 length:294 start_codon:yes stop_codon:yes gene_type:complete